MNKENWNIAWALWAFTYSFIVFILPWLYAVVIWLPLMLGISCWMKIEYTNQLKKEVLS